MAALSAPRLALSCLFIRALELLSLSGRDRERNGKSKAAPQVGWSCLRERRRGMCLSRELDQPRGGWALGLAVARRGARQNIDAAFLTPCDRRAQSDRGFHRTLFHTVAGYRPRSSTALPRAYDVLASDKACVCTRYRKPGQRPGLRGRR